MNVTAVLSAKALRYVVIKSGIYIPDVVRALQDRYGFVGVPASREQMFPVNQPVVFSHGKMVHNERNVVVLTLEIYPTGLLVETATSTDDCDLFIDDLLEWGVSNDWKSGGFAPPWRPYASQLELALDVPLERCFPMVNKIGEMMAAPFKEYHMESVPPFQVHSLGMNVDPTRFSMLCDFRIERRVKVAYTQNAYFSQAPLKTHHHTAILEELERDLKKAAGP